MAIQAWKCPSAFAEKVAYKLVFKITCEHVFKPTQGPIDSPALPVHVKLAYSFQRCL